jgi:uncharacterized protein
MSNVRHQKLEALLDTIRPMKSAVLAYSGGVDSTLVLKALALSGIRALAVTGVSPTTPPRDLEDAIRLAAEAGVEHHITETQEMASEDFVQNTPERCFHCKDELFGRLMELAKSGGFAVVLDGSNADDAGGHRPGLRAAAKHGVRSPLIEAGLTKHDVREVSRELGLSTWDKPASPCLSSRFPYGVRITPEALGRVSKAEDFMRRKGFSTLRVRDHGGMARIELPEGDISRALAAREEIAAGLRALGFDFVSLDMEGFRSGSLDRVIRDERGC